VNGNNLTSRLAASELPQSSALDSKKIRRVRCQLNRLILPTMKPGLPEFLSRKLLADAEGQAGSRPRKLFVASEDEADELVKVAKVMGVEVVRVPVTDLSDITQEAREGFAAHVPGGRVQ